MFLYTVPGLRRGRNDRQGRAETHCDDKDFSHINLPVSKAELIPCSSPVVSVYAREKDRIRDNCVGIRQFRLSSNYVAYRQATWAADNLLRLTVYVRLREDKPADQVRRE